mgnify:CR=1 FL=1
MSNLFDRISNFSLPQFDGSQIVERGLSQARSAIQEFTGEARGFMRNIRSAGLPRNGNPTQQVQTAATFSSPGEQDWRVRLSLPNDPSYTSSPLLQPLVTTGGLVFPYTPTMIISHTANYSAIHPVHTNYPFYAYENSQVDQLVITGSFVVQNSLEAQYWVAVVHYLRSVTKMYYGNSQPQGMPPPAVRLNGYGDYVFNDVPVIITNFTIDMPQDVDYVATELGVSSGDFIAATDYDTRGASISYAPAESNVTIQCQPIYSRAQQESFSLNSFINGDYVTNGSGYI